MSILLYGIGLGGGISIGSAFIFDKRLDDATCHYLEDNEIENEVLQFEEALIQTRKELELLRGSIPSSAPAELGAFLSLSIMMLGDSQISQAPLKIIRDIGCNAQWAIKLQADVLATKFDRMEDEYLKERKHDVLQVLERIFKNLEGNRFDWEEGGKLEKGILITHDLSPADLVHFKDSNFSGFVTEVGSLTSHTAIVGRNLEIPSIIGVGYARQLIRDDDLIIVDGLNGVLIINPAEIILEQYKQIQANWVQSQLKLKEIRKDLTRTLDGVTVDLLANIESDMDLGDVKYYNASGIGLFRSEFLFLAKANHLVSEDEQFEVYVKIAKAMKKLPVTIRTADLGADKNPLWNEDDAENGAINPALGLTGIRLSLADQAFFRIQLRAILRASCFGNIQIMFPMISSSGELKQAINQLTYAMEELDEESILYNKNIKIGVMIEVPSAAIAIRGILSQVDFISIGTNDLIQYLLAVDRNDEQVSYLYNPLHPAVINILLHLIKSCDKSAVPASICGEMAGDPRLTRLLLGMGYRKFSMYSANILNIKNIILNTDISKITRIISKILKTESIDRIEELMDTLNDDLDL